MITKSIYLKQNELGKKQDFVYVGQTNKKKDFSVVADGHGHSKVIEVIKSIQWESVLDRENIGESIYSFFPPHFKTTNSGSTISIVLVSDNNINIYWIGDSTIKVYRDQKKTFQTSAFQGKIIPLRTKTKKNINVLEIFDLSSKYIGSMNREKKCFYYLLPNNDTLAMPHALGHDNSTGKKMKKKVIIIEENINYTILSASDGLWDLTHPNDENVFIEAHDANDIGNIVHRRWHGVWLFNENQSSFEKNNIDDIAIAMIKINKKK